MKLSGSIENIIFRNEENGYTVLELDADGCPVTCVGNFPIAAEGQSIEAEGEYKTGKYGQQFVCTGVRYDRPRTLESITRYLASGLIKGIGPATALRIVDLFGSDTMDIIEKNPSRLTEVKGITVKKAGEIGAAVMRLKDIQNAVMYLQQYRVTVNTALKIYKAYGADTERVLAANPYRLVEDVEGIGFLTADKIALSMGIAQQSPFRMRAGVLYALHDIAEDAGCTYYPREKLYGRAGSLLELDLDDESLRAAFDAVLNDLATGGVVKLFEREGGAAVMLSHFYHMEKNIAVRLVRLKGGAVPLDEDAGPLIDDYARREGIVLHGAQSDAVAMAVEHGVSVVTGGPGTGKTTIVRCILSVLKHHGLRVSLCAPTGRAAKRLSESTGEDARTIHRLLEFDFATGRFIHNEHNKLEADAVIVDEVSMVDAALFSAVLKALAEGSRLILVGDKDQLPSVGAGNVLAELIASGCFPVTVLTEIYRQSKESLIVLSAHAVNRGELPDLARKSGDFFFVERHSPQDIADTVLDLVLNRLPKFSGHASAEIQVLAPMKKGAAGVENLNQRLQQSINPPDAGKRQLFFEERVFREGDKVMQTANNYRLEWRKDTFPAESGQGVYNGDIGTVASVDGQFEMTVLFEDGRAVQYSVQDIGDLVHAYAISIHKSQGCEFDAVVIPVTGGPPTLFTRNLLYTAVTRAKKLVVLVGSQYNVGRMVENNDTHLRYSMLSAFFVETERAYRKLTGDGESGDDA